MKKVSVAKQLKDSKVEVAALAAKLAELEKKLTQETSYKEMYSRRASEADAEVESMHDILDTMQKAPARRVEGKYRDTSLSVRFAGWLASRAC